MTPFQPPQTLAIFRTVLPFTQDALQDKLGQRKLVISVRRHNFRHLH